MPAGSAFGWLAPAGPCTQKQCNISAPLHQDAGSLMERCSGRVDRAAAASSRQVPQMAALAGNTGGSTAVLCLMLERGVTSGSTCRECRMQHCSSA